MFKEQPIPQLSMPLTLNASSPEVADEKSVVISPVMLTVAGEIGSAWMMLIMMDQASTM